MPGTCSPWNPCVSLTARVQSVLLLERSNPSTYSFCPCGYQPGRPHRSPGLGVSPLFLQLPRRVPELQSHFFPPCWNLLVDPPLVERSPCPPFCPALCLCSVPWCSHSAPAPGIPPLRSLPGRGTPRENRALLRGPYLPQCPSPRAVSAWETGSAFSRVPRAELTGGML